MKSVFKFPLFLLCLPGLILFVWPVCAQAQISEPKSSGSTRATEALDEVNAIRKANGLAPYVRDDGLTIAAAKCALARAENLIQGHTSNDFAYLPAGSTADAAGCAAWHPSMGWGSCAMFDDYVYGGAAFVVGVDGKRYMHLFVRGGSGRTLGQRVPLKCDGPTCTAPSVSVGVSVEEVRFPRMRGFIGRFRR